MLSSDPTFPIEIQRSILSHLTSPPDSPRPQTFECRRALANCMRANKDFAAIAAPLLYEHLCLPLDLTDSQKVREGRAARQLLLVDTELPADFLALDRQPVGRGADCLEASTDQSMEDDHMKKSDNTSTLGNGKTLKSTLLGYTTRLTLHLVGADADKASWDINGYYCQLKTDVESDSEEGKSSGTTDDPMLGSRVGDDDDDNMVEEELNTRDENGFCRNGNDSPPVQSILPDLPNLGILTLVLAPDFVEPPQAPPSKQLQSVKRGDLNPNPYPSLPPLAHLSPHTLIIRNATLYHSKSLLTLLPSPQKMRKVYIMVTSIPSSLFQGKQQKRRFFSLILADLVELRDLKPRPIPYRLRYRDDIFYRSYGWGSESVAITASALALDSNLSGGLVQLFSTFDPHDQEFASGASAGRRLIRDHPAGSPRTVVERHTTVIYSPSDELDVWSKYQASCAGRDGFMTGNNSHSRYYYDTDDEDEDDPNDENDNHPLSHLPGITKDPSSGKLRLLTRSMARSAILTVRLD